MSSRRQRVNSAFVAAFLIALVSWQVVSAYATCCKWSSSNITFYYSATLPFGYQDATSYGASQWTNVTTSSFIWTSSGDGLHPIALGTLDGPGNSLAVTNRSIAGSTIVDMDIRYDNSESWYTGSGTPMPSQVDLRSAAAHEFGHALGLYHTQTGNCPGGSANPTMCNGYPAGTYYFRTLETDDKSGVAFLYP